MVSAKDILEDQILGRGFTPYPKPQLPWDESRFSYYRELADKSKISITLVESGSEIVLRCIDSRSFDLDSGVSPLEIDLVLPDSLDKVIAWLNKVQAFYHQRQSENIRQRRAANQGYQDTRKLHRARKRDGVAPVRKIRPPK